MDEQQSRERQDKQTTEQKPAQGGAQSDARGINPVQHSEGKPAANAAESGPDQLTGEGTGARAGEYS